jgi:hypothetical protein
MIREEQVISIRLLKEKGHSIRFISKHLGIDRKTVKRVLRDDKDRQYSPRNKKDYPIDQIMTYLEKHNGWRVATHQALKRDGIDIPYSTMTRLIREDQPSRRNKLAVRHGDKPGEEFQHDTSDYEVTIGGKKRKIIASSLVYRFSKIRFIKFYLRFNRFLMRAFMDEALRSIGYGCEQCVIDNTSLVVIRGSGPRAVIADEMISFAKERNFIWIAHEINHSDRKGGVEKSFYYLTTNFFPGRTFANLTDLNRQVATWCDELLDKTPSRQQSSRRELLAKEKPFMKPILPTGNSPFESFIRKSDQYGWVRLHSNFYFYGRSFVSVRIIAFAQTIEIYPIRSSGATGKTLKYRRAAQDEDGCEIRPIGSDGLPDLNIRPNNRKANTLKPRTSEKLSNHSKLMSLYLEAACNNLKQQKTREKLFTELDLWIIELSDDAINAIISAAYANNIFDLPSLRRLRSIHKREQDRLVDEKTIGLHPLSKDFKNHELANTEKPDLSKYDNRLKKENQ